MGKMEAVAFAFFIKGAFDIKQRIATSYARARVPQDKQVHSAIAILEQRQQLFED